MKSMPSVGSGAAGARALPGTCHVPKDAGIPGDSACWFQGSVIRPTLPRKYLSAQVFQFPVETEHNSKDDLQGYKKHFRKTAQEKQVKRRPDLNHKVSHSIHCSDVAPFSNGTSFPRTLVSRPPG